MHSREVPQGSLEEEAMDAGLSQQGVLLKQKPGEEGQLGQSTPAGKALSWKEAARGLQDAPGNLADV